MDPGWVRGGVGGDLGSAGGETGAGSPCESREEVREPGTGRCFGAERALGRNSARRPADCGADPSSTRLRAAFPVPNRPP